MPANREANNHRIRSFLESGIAGSMFVDSEPKPWGRSSCVYRDDSIEIVRIDVVAGGFSSVHLHRDKSNEFSVFSGKLEVYTESGEGFSLFSLEKRSHPLFIPPGVRHLFHAKTVVVAWEIYRAEARAIDAGDIVRFSKNGIGEPNL